MLITIHCPACQFARSLWVRSRFTAKREALRTFPFLSHTVFAWWIDFAK